MRSIDYGDGLLYFSTHAKSRKVSHFYDDPEAACLVFGAEVDGRMPWLSVHGRTEIRVPTAAR